ncbi:hypothetical protein K435DRAFT_418124 [Dendrothele bispora CBS 962.96]|uniref:Crinkler effector protein N-terminal domain-containing protein n=1 Tax=Dendrothele bispora (strain CBS 962.96) TaxID=1314807 RepID=A0A4S8MV98_DENBC|nr:hypothetical protein K435DRAFT_418124 [Dendrothele bispora CBS 962.96]
MIKQEDPDDLKAIAAHKLELFDVSVPDGGDIATKVKAALTVGDKEPLRATKMLSKVFPEPQEETIHIAVKLPYGTSSIIVQQGMGDGKVAALKRAMSNPFVGLATAALFDHLINCRRLFREGATHTRFYAKFTSVCNSSGTGKTRAVLQLRDHHVPVVYINLRPVSDSLNYPPSDFEIAPLLKRPTDSAAEFFLTSLT